MAMIANQMNQQLSNDANITTVQDLINRKQTKSIVDYSELSFSMTVDNSITIPFQNVITTTYAKELNDLAVEVTMTDKEYYKYRYRPKLLAYDLYNYTELFYIIDFINGIYNIKDFNKKVLKLIPKKELFDFLSEVRQADINNIESFNNKFVE